jgi:hypothetical protein
MNRQVYRLLAGCLFTVVLTPVYADGGQTTAQRLDMSALKPVTGLEQQTGKQGVTLERVQVFSRANLSGAVGDNYLADVTSGSNVISGSAFTGMNGIGTVIQNSGNQVLIQSSTIINVAVH